MEVVWKMSELWAWTWKQGWFLAHDVQKTNKQTNKVNVVVFSRGKIRQTPMIKYNGQRLKAVFDFRYLRLCFHYNNEFSMAQKYFYDPASRSMFDLLKKCRKLMLPWDIQTFNSCWYCWYVGWWSWFWCHRIQVPPLGFSDKFFFFDLTWTPSSPTDSPFHYKVN